MYIISTVSSYLFRIPSRSFFFSNFRLILFETCRFWEPKGLPIWIQNHKKNSLRYAHTRRPAHTLRWCLLRHQTLETPFCRSYLSGHPTPPHPHPHPNKTPTPPPIPPHPHPTPPPHPTPQWPKDGPMGPMGLFRSHFEWQAVSSGWRFRMESHFEWMAMSNGPTRMEGATSAPIAPMTHGGIGLMGPLGVWRSYSEWKAIPKVKLFRSSEAIPTRIIPWSSGVECNFEWRAISDGRFRTGCFR